MAASLAAEADDSRWKYNAFLNFRGKDVRRNFISHLYDALKEEGLTIFHDDEELQRGDFIEEGLEKGMKQSRFAIVVISEDYATSQWCLRELSYLVDLAEKKPPGIGLIPIFYGIDPSILKSRTGCFSEALKKHEQRFGPEMVKKWREALATVGNISGWDSKSRDNDSKLVHEVVQDLVERLYLDEAADESTDLVGMSFHKKRIESLLSLDSEDDVQMLGLWGMGGRGKTTIANCIFKGLSSKFPDRCFLENVKSDFQKHGASHLRKQIMSEIFPKSPLNPRCINSDAMKRRLRGKKVLLVLDDVDDVEQLQELAGNCNWFGPGSRIIITTRDKRVLDEHHVKLIYEVKPLRTTQAIQLFSKHAFKMNRPREEFRELCLDIVEKLGGLPLAVRVVGASLYDRKIGFWENKLCILKNKCLDKPISLALKASYDALDDHEKSVFLYVAGCFHGEYMNRAIMVLDPLVIKSEVRLVTLMEKSLISKSNNTRLWVHDLLQDMAKDITCEGRLEKPWKRKMMWNSLDVKGLFTENMGSKDIEVESILLNMAEETGFCINPETFKKMICLKFLKIHNNLSIGGSKVCIVGDFDYLPPLRYLRWEAYTLKSLPSDFKTHNLVELMFPVLGNGVEKMFLNGTMIEEVPSSIGENVNLLCLDMSECKKLRNLPDTLRNLKKLKLLYLRGCVNITKMPHVAGEIRRLDLYGTSIEKYGVLSEEEALELHNRDMEFAKGFLTRFVRNYKRGKNSR
ncbi:unnamed protein product [Thlaspi arvense]|uniref:TIR domain-containing protein n=1 Tax=Thlaspi arvense TaxID=13288 RepID=A0AAU9T2N7_THLAR|nr:unnamed protein product [Thlaspi arvense]